MRLHLLVPCVFSLSLCFGQIEEGDQTPMTPKEEIIEELLSERESNEALTKAEGKARELGVSEQAILEARFLFHVDRSEDAEIAAMLPKFLDCKNNFVLADSEIFASEDDFHAVVEYVHAIAAIEKGDKEGFKKHITEAFWLSPQQGAVFAPHIERVRLTEAMKDVQVDLGFAYASVMDERKPALRELLGEDRAMLLHFWSPLSPECEMTLPEFFLSAAHFIEKDIAVASVLPETSDKVKEAANKMLKETGKELPGTWLVDSVDKPLSAQLHVKTVPVVVLLSREGKVLYNGHPTDELFWQALESINPDIERPVIHEE